jgi:hypothetical protein
MYQFRITVIYAKKAKEQGPVPKAVHFALPGTDPHKNDKAPQR